MKLIFNTIPIFIVIVFVFGQRSNLTSSDYDKSYPQYFFAIESAAEGDFKEALPAFEKMLVQFPSHQEALLLREICSDAIDKKISVNAAEYFFEGINARNNSADLERVVFYLNPRLLSYKLAN